MSLIYTLLSSFSLASELWLDCLLKNCKDLALCICHGMLSSHSRYMVLKHAHRATRASAGMENVQQAMAFPDPLPGMSSTAM